jgi:integrase/recombinase XerD
MTELRTRMDNDMLVRGMAERTRETYLAAVARLARYYHRPPDQLTPSQVQAYVVHMLREEHCAWSTCNIAVQVFRFLYHTTLGHPEPTFPIPGPKHRQTLPEIWSPVEVRRVLEATVTRKQRAVLATTYGAGLRVSEVVHLHLRHIDADRMSRRVEQGKGGIGSRHPPLAPPLRGTPRRLAPVPAGRMAGPGPRRETVPGCHHCAEVLHRGQAARRDHEAGRHPRPPPRRRHAPPGGGD